MSLARLLPTVALLVAIPSPASSQTEGNPERWALTEKLAQRYPNGLIPTADGSTIKVTDVAREVSPLLPKLRAASRDEQDYQAKVDELSESAVRRLGQRAALIREFRADGSRAIPESYVDNAIADEIAERFGGDRAKFLEHLRAQNKTIGDYRRDVEENIIHSYMRNQQRQAQAGGGGAANAPKAAADHVADAEPRVHLRLIQLTRAPKETDAALQARADKVLERFRAGERFESLARELSGDIRAAKGGDWGWQKRADFRPEFATIAFGLNKGEVSAPVLLPQGAFILYLEDRK